MFVFLANQFIGSTISSGGDVLFLEIAKRIDYPSVIIAPSSVKQEFSKSLTNHQFVSSETSKSVWSAGHFLGGIITVSKYIQRAVVTYLWLKKNVKKDDTLYLTGDFISNTLPILLLALFGDVPENIYGNFFHRNPKPKHRPGNPYLISLVSRFLQSCSLLILRRFAKTMFVLTELGKQELITHNFDENNIVISGAGISKQIKEYQNTEKNNQRIIYLGRLNQTKGIFDAIEALSILYQRGIKFELILIGPGTPKEINETILRAEKAEISELTKVLGFVDEKTKFSLIASSKALVFPSKEEGFGIAPYECLCLNTAVCCYNLPVLQMLFGNNPLVSFSPISDITALADNLEKVMHVQFNPTTMENQLFTSPQTWDNVFTIQNKYLNIK